MDEGDEFDLDIDFVEEKPKKRKNVILTALKRAEEKKTEANRLLEMQYKRALEETRVELQKVEEKPPETKNEFNVPKDLDLEGMHRRYLERVKTMPALQLELNEGEVGYIVRRGSYFCGKKNRE